MAESASAVGTWETPHRLPRTSGGARRVGDPRPPLVIFRGQTSSVEAFDLRRSPAARRPVLRCNDHDQHRLFEVHAACDGLLVVSLSNGRLYICNPATRQWATLPSLAGSSVAGFYQHSPSGEYRVLYREWRSHGGGDGHYVITVGSSAEPRRIGSVADVSGRPPILLHSCLHWGHRSKQELIAFDTVAESFRSIRAPAAYGWAWSDLFDTDSMLGVSIITAKMLVELWVLQDYEMEVWSLKYLIRLPDAELRSTAMNRTFDVLIVSENGDVLVYKEPNNVHLLHYGSNGKLLQKFRWDGVFPMVTRHWFRESLFKHSFFQNQTLGCVRQPSQAFFSFVDFSTG